MELPVLELREKITEELEKNPALEILRDKSVVSLNELAKQPGDEAAFFETSSDAGFLPTGRGEAASDEHRRFIEAVLCRPETLQEHLLMQLKIEPVSPEIRRLGELLIQNLSGDGFHKEAVHLLLKPPPAAEMLDAALKLVQSFDPQGCCTADYKESLAVQAELYFGAEAEDLKALIPYLEELEKGKFLPVARKLKKSEEDLAELFEKFKKLSPFPGRQFAESGNTGETKFVIPDLKVVRKEGALKIIINNEEMPVLGIAPFFLKNADIANAAGRNFIRENVKEAKWFINALNRRNHTLFRVSKAIVHFQRDFFERGPKYLAPLSLSDIAKKLDLHEATISRTANGKYMETEWGVFELRRFFSNSISKESAQHFSKEGVKEIIREIIEEEKSSLSDNDIVRLLAERGITLARRTVAKYRSQLDLGSSYRR